MFDQQSGQTFIESESKRDLRKLRIAGPLLRRPFLFAPSRASGVTVAASLFGVGTLAGDEQRGGCFLSLANISPCSLG